MRGNDWRSIAVPPVEVFEPSRPISVIIPYYEAPEALSLTLAGLQVQTYPRELLEVIVVDDGSSTPLQLDTAPPLRVQVIHQPDLGFGLARARNNGARAAAGEILVFLDCDMVPEACWLTSHARWHHAASDVLSLGFRKHLNVDGITAEAVQTRSGSLGELFAGRPTEEPEWIETRMARTDMLTSGDEDIFRAVTGGNLGVSTEFFAAAGGFDESFNQWGAEDREFGYRAFALGAILVPDRKALCWHQGPGARISEIERLSLAEMKVKLMDLIPHGRPRDTSGRRYSVPRFVVTVTAGDADQRQTLETVQQVLSSTASDLVVWVEEPPGDGFEWLHDRLESEHRVRFGPAGAAAAEFRSARFHIEVPAGTRVGRSLIERLPGQLGLAASGRARLRSGHQVTITRSWALQRALRSGVPVREVGDIVDISSARVTAACSKLARDAKTVASRASRVRGPRDAWALLTWVLGATRRRVVRR